MRILLSVEHPAWVHQFRYIIKELELKGHEIKVLAISKDITCDLLDIFGIPYEMISETSGKNIIQKGIIFLKTTYSIYNISRQFKPDLYFGRYSPMMAINSYIFRKPHIIFEDTEHAIFCLTVCRLFSAVIMTPTCFKKDLGKKQLRIDAYKELFYLYPKYFQPNPKILKEMKIEEDEKIIIVRFVAWDAHHDIGQHGIRDRVGLVKSLQVYGHVLITSEGPLPEELEQYRIRVSPEKLHDLLYYATLYVGEGGTTASEAALLGTHAIFISTIAKYCGNFNDINRYGLLWTTDNDEDTLKKAVELLQVSDLKNLGRSKRDRLIAEKIDVNKFMLWFIENYPESAVIMKEKPEFQNTFR